MTALGRAGRRNLPDLWTSVVAVTLKPALGMRLAQLAADAGSDLDAYGAELVASSNEPRRSHQPNLPRLDARTNTTRKETDP